MVATQTYVTEQQNQFKLSVGNLEAPQITMLGTLDDDKGTKELNIEAQGPKQFLAIIYTGL